MKALVGTFNQEKALVGALVGAFSVIVQLVVEPMDQFAALDEVHTPALAELRLAAALAAQGHLTELQFLHLDNLDISSVPPGELGALVRCVRGCVILSSVRGDLASVLANIDCDELIIPNGTLGTED